MDRLELERTRDLTTLVSDSFSAWWQHLAVFLTLAALVVFPVTFLVDGLWAGALSDADATGPWQAEAGSIVIWTLVVSPLITAMHVLVVLDLAKGAAPGVGAALASGIRVLPWVIIAVALYTVAAMLGLLLLIIPGIWVSVACYFSAQAAVVDGARGLQSLQRSREIVQHQWWRTLGILIVLGLLAALLALPLGYVTQIVGAVSDSGPLYVLGTAIAQTIALSFTALAGTLFFFDLRYRKGARTVPERSPLIPEAAAS